jgi:hypothetical protein
MSMCLASERLEHVIVGPAVKAAQAIVKPVARRDDEHWNWIALVANVGKHIHPIFSRQAEIKQHHVVMLAS